MIQIFIYILLCVLLIFNIIYIKWDYNKNKVKKSYTFFGVKNKYLLTRNELSFFYKLKKITDKYELYLFPKIRLADIIDTSDFSNFGKIRSKHIDFTISDKYCSPLLFIELDDNSHRNFKNKENDIKKDYIMESVNATLVRIKLSEIDFKLQYIEYLINNKRLK